jgi:hypothetical protein
VKELEGGMRIRRIRIKREYEQLDEHEICGMLFSWQLLFNSYFAWWQLWD